ncbi:MAG: hypothetical protein JSV04_03780 [Candidatus Heimdallarchaeota archaeon]|nr:MAG: hypothetical protein JSV04_03780 [Candidatus Heimdallarchaeota archaeon]
MNLKKVLSIYAVTVGALMLISWVILFGINQSDLATDIKTKPIEMLFVLINEILTACTLIIGGYGLFSNRVWGSRVFLLGTGMLTYSMINNLGFSLQHSDILMVSLMLFLIPLNFLFIILVFSKSRTRIPITVGITTSPP